MLKAGEAYGTRGASTEREPTAGNTASGPRFLLSLRDPDRKAIGATRWYDAAIGRWLSEDPIGFDAGDGNLSRYVGNQTPSRTDSSGLQEPGQATFDMIPPMNWEKVLKEMGGRYGSVPPLHSSGATQPGVRRFASTARDNGTRCVVCIPMPLVGRPGSIRRPKSTFQQST